LFEYQIFLIYAAHIFRNKSYVYKKVGILKSFEIQIIAKKVWILTSV